MASALLRLAQPDPDLTADALRSLRAAGRQVPRGVRSDDFYCR